MARKKRSYHRRTTEEHLADLEARLEGMKQHVRDQRKFSAAAVLEERERLELSAADYGELVGVTGLTIYNWEKGRSEPRAAQLDKWLAVRGIGKREAWRPLDIV